MNAAARTDFVIETSALTKHYGDVVAVNDLTLRVPRGGVFGFLRYYRTEQLIVALFLSFFSWFQNVADYLLVRNISGWTGGVGGFPRGAALPDETHAIVVLAVYTLALGGIAFWPAQWLIDRVLPVTHQLGRPEDEMR